MTANKELGSPAVASGQWLYRRGELVLGPVPTEKLGQLLLLGEIDGKTEISTLGSNAFRRLSEVPEFGVQLAKAQAKQRIENIARIEREKARKQRNVHLVIISIIAVAVATAAAMGARYFAVHNPFKKLELAEITVEPPTITRFRSRHRDDDLVDYPGAKRLKVAERSTRVEHGGGGARMSSAAEDAEGMQTAKFDKDGIHSVVAAHQKSLYVCFTEEAGRNPKLAGKFPIEFVIGNDGRVSKLWVDNPDYKQGALADCLLRELQKWPFQPYQGEQATVGLSFNVRGRG